MIQEAIVKIVDKQDLTYDEAYAVMNEIMSGETTRPRTPPFWPLCPPRVPGRRPARRSPGAPPPCGTTPPNLRPICPSLKS